MSSIKAGGANLGDGWGSWGPPRTAVGYSGIALQFKSLKETTVETVRCFCQEEFLQFCAKSLNRQKINLSHHYEFVCCTLYNV